jgi:hypothetical protein
MFRRADAPHAETTILAGAVVVVSRRILYLGPFSSGPFGEGLRALLERIGEFRVVPIEDPEMLATDVSDESGLLVMEGSDPSACRRFLAVKSVRMVVLIDPADALTFIGVDNPRWKSLGDFIRAVTEDSDASTLHGDDNRVRVVSAESFASDRRQDSRPVQGDFTSLIRWIELRLATRLSQRTDDGDSGVAGWSVSTREAIDMLLVDPAEHIAGSRRQGDLVDRLLDADRDLFVTGRTLPSSISNLRDAFDLSMEELRFLVLVLAPEIDGRFATAIGVLQDDLTRRRPGLTLMAELQIDDELSTWDLRRRLHESDSLIAKGLVRVESEGLAVEAPIQPSAAVVAYLLSHSPDLVAAAIGAKWWKPAPVLDPPCFPEEERLARQLKLVDPAVGPVRLVGGDRSKRWFGRLASGLGMTLLVGNFVHDESSAERMQKANDWSVLVRLVGGGLLLLGTDALAVLERLQIAEVVRDRVGGSQLVAADGEFSDGRGWTSAVVLEAPAISAAERSAWWTTSALEAGLHLGGGDPGRLAATVKLDPVDYGLAVAMAVRQAAAGMDGTLAELVQWAARKLTRSELPPGVRRIEPVYGWDDIVVSDENKILLKSIPQHVLYEGRVIEEWGFGSRLAYGRGIAALFSGPSGTGKTMAGQIIARDLGLDLLQVDLSKTVSKYIGDTEKNLDRVFEAAESSGSVLLFDEADAIFGRRTEIKDAHDRHANVEVAYLLQRLESFQGLTILTTNLKQNIDSAFTRRLRFIIDFELPTAAERVKIWHKAFPKGVLADGEPDVAAIASRLSIAGGSIQNIALHAAFLAAADDDLIGLRHLSAAMRRELSKMGMRSAVSILDERMPAMIGPGGTDQRVAS